LFDIDHIIPKAHGGGDYLENYQLLCRTCNTTKGARPMAFLLQRIDLIRKLRREVEY
jgi:5-methylcytosine-specific restriction endonuclease McrA